MRYWRFDQHPEEMISSDTLSLQEGPKPQLGRGEVLLRNLYVSMDATNRLWLGKRKELYIEPLSLGDTMKGFTLSVVEESDNPAFAPGQIVTWLGEWADYSVSNGLDLIPFSAPAEVPLADAFGVLNIAGPTAYYGLLEIGQPRPGETVVVTAASGAVGSLTGQIAKLAGCRVVGTAGSDEKCRRLIEEFGFDAAINYKQPDFADKLAAACPNGIDIQFENVGGDILDHCLTLMNNGGRVVICGLIAMYNSEQNVPGPYMFHNTIMKRLKIEGFVILDHMQDFPKMQYHLAQWMSQGKLNYRLEVIEGLEHAVDALNSLYTGSNDGKVMIKVGPEPAR